MKFRKWQCKCGKKFWYLEGFKKHLRKHKWEKNSHTGMWILKD